MKNNRPNNFGYTQPPSPVTPVGLDELPLTNATRNILLRRGYRTQEDLSEITLGQLANMPGIASKRCYEMLLAVKFNGSKP